MTGPSQDFSSEYPNDRTRLVWIEVGAQPIDPCIFFEGTSYVLVDVSSII